MARKSEKRGKIPPPTRPSWSGMIRMSLVTIPVNIFNAVDSDGEVHFNQIHRPSGQRVRYVKTVPGIGEIESADIVKGFEVEKNEYVLVENAELKELKIESSSSFNIVQFVDREAIDARYFNQPFYVAPSDQGAIEGFCVIRDALVNTRKVGLGQIVLGGRERLACIQPCGKGMLMETLRYVDDLRDAKVYFAPIEEVKADKDQLDLATRLIEQKVADFKPDLFEDHYETAVREMIDRKRTGKRIIVNKCTDTRPSAEIVDIMEALKRSLAGQPTKRQASAANDSGGPVRRKRAAGRAKA